MGLDNDEFVTDSKSKKGLQFISDSEGRLTNNTKYALKLIPSGFQPFITRLEKKEPIGQQQLHLLPPASRVLRCEGLTMTEALLTTMTLIWSDAARFLK